MSQFLFGPANSQINKIKGVANGIAELDASGKVPSNQLPSYVDDVVEYDSVSDFPEEGETGKIYVAIDTNKSYRWSGSSYIELSSYALATQAAAGLMSANDKSKLDGIASGAQVNPGNATTSAAGLMSAADKTKLDGVAAGAQVNPGNATTSAAGLMSANDKSKLDGIASGATANVGTITGITMNGSSKGTSGVVDLGTVLTSHQDISGKVSGPSSATNNAVAIFDGTGGKTIKNSGYTIGKSVPSDAVFTDTNTTYSFVDKNVTLAWSTTHTIATVGGTNIRVTMPANPNTNTTYSFSNNAPTLSWGNTSTVGTVGGVALTVKMPANPNTNTTYSFSNNAPTLAWNTTSTVGTVGGVALTVKMPANPNTNTTYANATQSVAGLMSAADKYKLDSCSGSARNVRMGQWVSTYSSSNIEANATTKYVWQNYVTPGYGSYLIFVNVVLSHSYNNGYITFHLAGKEQTQTVSQLDNDFHPYTFVFYFTGIPDSQVSAGFYIGCSSGVIKCRAYTQYSVSYISYY